MSEGWFGRGSGNGCWRRRPRRLRLVRAQPAVCPPGTAAKPVSLDLPVLRRRWGPVGRQRPPLWGYTEVVPGAQIPNHLTFPSRPGQCCAQNPQLPGFPPNLALNLTRGVPRPPVPARPPIFCTLFSQRPWITPRAAF